MNKMIGLVALHAVFASDLLFSQTPERRGSLVTAGDVRFSILSPSCIRLEWAPDKIFIDQPTFIAMERPTGYDKFISQTADGTLTIATGELNLAYRLGSGDFSGTNLKITVESTGTAWTPASARPSNLGGTVSSLNSYKGGPIPGGAGLLTKQGYYILKDESKLIDNTEWRWYSSRPSGTRTNWYFFGYGKDYAKAFADFILVSGRVPLLPRKAFGFWWSKMSCGSEQSVRELFKEFDARKIPVDMLSFGMQWHINGWTGYTWEKSAYPDPAAMMQWLHGRGLKVFQSHHYGAFRSNEPSFAQVSALTGLNGSDTFNFALKNHAQAFMDYVAEPIEKTGCDHWWLDGYFPGPSGIDGQVWSNHVYMTHMQKTRPNTRQMILSRWGGWGSHRYPVQFSGDVISNWESLKGEVNFTAKSGNALAGYWSHDIGGYKGLGSNSRLYVRWSQFAAFSPIYRYHSSGEERRPWMFGEEAERVVKKFINLRQQLIPYMYTLAREYYETGLPLCRPLYISWPDHEMAYSYEGQYAEYMLGNNLLVAPVHSSDDKKELWFPPDHWTDIFSGTTFQGPRLETLTVPLDYAPVFARAGSFIPLQPVMTHSAERPLDTLLLKVFPPVNNVRPRISTLYEDDGESMSFTTNQFSRTTFTQEYSNSGSSPALRLTLGSSQGSYNGKPGHRTYLLEVYNVTTRPTRVTASGVALTENFSEQALRTGQGYLYQQQTKRLLVSAGSSSDRSLEILIDGFAPISGTVGNNPNGNRITVPETRISTNHSSGTLRIESAIENAVIDAYRIDGRKCVLDYNKTGPGSSVASLQTAPGPLFIRVRKHGPVERDATYLTVTP